MPSDQTGDAVDSPPPAAAQESSEPQPPQPPAHSSSAGSRGPDKTISCVSCRRRKLRCDRSKPTCGTCRRLRHECDYPERKRNLGSRRRNMKELEERLAQVETRLVAEQNLADKGQDVDIDWNVLADSMDLPLGDGDFLQNPSNMPSSGFGPESLAYSVPMDNLFSGELISLGGLQEPLPPQDMMDELYSIYFERFHPIIPMIHKARFYASLNRGPHVGPPVCLQYAMFTTAASMHEKYACYEDLFYERARKYADAAEMKGHGETFVNVYHAQTWGLLGNYEAKKTYFSRSWMSIGRIVRLSYMLGLHRLDGAEQKSGKKILPPPADFLEHEERRRTFWAAFYGDRWASSGTGWPMMIDEKEIFTNLPTSEESFEQGIEETTISLEKALSPEGVSQVSRFGGVIVSAALFGRNYQHLHRTGPDEHAEDTANGEFWKRHRQMDNVLSNTFMFLPDHLRLYGLPDTNIVFLHMNIHASIICLHQGAVMTAERFESGSNIVRQSRARSLMAAEEITNLMRLISHVDASRMNSWMGFCLYLAGGVFIQNQKVEDPHPQGWMNLEFILIALKALAKKHPITEHFVAQLELDLQTSGIQRTSDSKLDVVEVPDEKTSGTAPPNVPMNGLIPARRNMPMTIADMEKLAQNAAQKQKEKATLAHKDPPTNLLPLHVYGSTNSVTNPSNDTIIGVAPKDNHWPGQSNGPEYDPYQVSTHPGAQSISPKTQADIQCSMPSPETSESVPATVAGNTPSSEASSSSTRQFPYRQPQAASQNRWPYENTTSSMKTPDWSMSIPQNEVYNLDPQQAAGDLDAYLNETMWNHDSSYR